MWVFTKHGFFKAVCARQGGGKYGQPVDTDRTKSHRLICSDGYWPSLEAQRPWS